jgi:hypothetical protein
VGGPFADRSGGLITFDADSLEQAAGIIAADPFVQEERVESSVPPLGPFSVAGILRIAVDHVACADI